MAISEIRPDIIAGPILRISRPEKVDSLNPGASSSAANEINGAHTVNRKMKVSRCMEFPTIDVLVSFLNYIKSRLNLIDQPRVASYGLNMKRSKSVDDYIAESEYWQDELRNLRKILCATALTEEIKWGAPCYTYKGKNVVGVGAYKSYVGLWFHQGALLADKNKVLINAQEGKTKALRQWRMQSEKDIKPVVIRRYVKEAIQLVDDGKQISPVRAKKLKMPKELSDALKKSKTAAKNFSGLTPGRQREYAEYISQAKREDTKLARVKKVLPLIAAGGGLHDKYRR